MLTLEELKDKIKTDYKSFELSPNFDFDGEYVSSFALTLRDNESLAYVYFWCPRLDSYISYLI